MYALSYKSGSSGNSNIQSKTGTTEQSIQNNEGFRVENSVQEKIIQANAVSITTVLRLFNIKIDNSTQKICCPFSNLHEDGIDKTPSFKIYHDTNSFYCWGCKEGGGCVYFVCLMDGLKPLKAALKILSSVDEGTEYISTTNNPINFSEKLEILMEFSNYIREHVVVNSNDTLYLKRIDDICAALDGLHEKYKNKMPNATLRVIVDRLKKKVEEV